MLIKRITVGVVLLVAAEAVLAATGGGGSPFSIGYFFQVIFSLVLVLGLVLAAVWGMKRLSLGVPGMKSPVKLVGGTMLGGKERVMVVEVGGEWLVLGVTAQSITVLKQLDKPPVDEADLTPVTPRFQLWLQQAIQKASQKNDAAK